jgi:hypothetical protein
MKADWRLDEKQFFVSRRAWSVVPRPLRQGLKVQRADHVVVRVGVTPCVFVFASEIVARGVERMPEPLMAPDTRYAIVVDAVPLPTLLEIPALLSLHKPNLRAHWTQDEGIMRRAMISLFRDVPGEAILDAYMLESRLSIILADLKKREVELSEIPDLRRTKPDVLADFQIDENGSYLYWPDPDVHLGVSQILQAIDPQYRAQVEIERNALDYTGWAVDAWRRELGLKQADVEGLSERHVRRIEQGVSRLTAPAAECFAQAFGLTTERFLNELAARTRKTREAVESEREARDSEDRAVVLFDMAA